MEAFASMLILRDTSPLRSPRRYLVHMGHFNSMTRPSDMNALFEQAGLLWMFEEYRRTTVYRNDTEETAL
jgi:hypothetical protein